MNVDPILKRYHRKRNHKPGSRKDIYYCLSLYEQATGLTPEKALHEADEETGIRLKNRRIKEHLDRFEEFLEDKDYSENTISGAISKVRSFYLFHEIELPRMDRVSRKNHNRETVEDLPNKENIKHALGVCKTSMKAIILLQASSGMGGTEVRSLNLRHLIKSLSEYCEVMVNDLFNICPY